MEYNKEYLKLGSIEMLVLNLLKKEDLHVFQIIGIFAKKSNCRYRVTEGSLHPILSELLYQGYITTYRALSEDNIMMDYYHIEDSGKKYFKKVMSDWLEALENVLAIMDTNYLL